MVSIIVIAIKKYENYPEIKSFEFLQYQSNNNHHDDSFENFTLESFLESEKTILEKIDYNLTNPFFLDFLRFIIYSGIFHFIRSQHKSKMTKSFKIKIIKKLMKFKKSITNSKERKISKINESLLEIRNNNRISQENSYLQNSNNMIKMPSFEDSILNNGKYSKKYQMSKIKSKLTKYK